jgi:hypothetical protein
VQVSLYADNRRLRKIHVGTNRLHIRTREAGFEITGIKILKTVTGDGWYASVTVRVTEEGGKAARGWVDVRPRGTRLVVDDWDSSEASDIGLFSEVIQIEGPAILDAVTARIPGHNRMR